MVCITHNKNYEKYERYYRAGFWNIEMLKNVVKKGKLTNTEFEEITGETYTA